MTPTAWDGAESWAARRSYAIGPRPAGWGGSRSRGWQVTRTSLRSPISPGSGLIVFMIAVRCGRSCSAWIRVSVRPMAITAYYGHFACTCYHRCSCSTSSAIWSVLHCVRATSTRRTTGRTCSNRSWPATGSATSAGVRRQPDRILVAFGLQELVDLGWAKAASARK